MESQMTPAEFGDLLRAFHCESDQRLRENHQRSLPFQDGAFDRWERARRLGFGERASIYNSSAVFGDVYVGTDTWIGPNTLLDGTGGGLSIGAFCSISSGVHIYTHDTVLWAVSGGCLSRRTGAVTVGDCTYIGSQSVIAAGVSIGDHVVVAANSFVNSDVPPRTIVGGTPARRLGSVVGEREGVKLEFDSR